MRSLLGCGERSLVWDDGRVIAFGIMGCGRCCRGCGEVRSLLWGYGDAITFWDDGSAIAFGIWGAIAFWDDGVRSLFWDDGMRSLWGCGGAILWYGLPLPC